MDVIVTPRTGQQNSLARYSARLRPRLSLRAVLNFGGAGETENRSLTVPRTRNCRAPRLATLHQLAPCTPPRFPCRRLHLRQARRTRIRHHLHPTRHVHIRRHVLVNLHLRHLGRAWTTAIRAESSPLSNLNTSARIPAKKSPSLSHTSCWSSSDGLAHISSTSGKLAKASATCSLLRGSASDGWLTYSRCRGR